MKRFIQALAAAFLLATALFILPVAARQAGDGKAVNPNVRFGMPKETKADEGNKEEFLVARDVYVLSYSENRRGPNWVSWRLVGKDLGPTERNPFVHDPTLPGTFTKLR